MRTEVNARLAGSSSIIGEEQNSFIVALKEYDDNTYDVIVTQNNAITFMETYNNLQEAEEVFREKSRG